MRLRAVWLVLGLAVLLPARGYAGPADRAAARDIVARAVIPVMRKFGIPGMAAGVVWHGKNYVFNFGVASKATRRPVTDDTLFEIGSISKTFTATLAEYAVLRGDLALSDMAGQDFPALRGSVFDHVSLLELGTHTAGGLPLQVPDEVTGRAQLMAFFHAWQPEYPPGTYRLYSNMSIGLLGLITAARMDGDFAGLMERTVFSPLGLKDSYLEVPAARLGDYAQGYTQADQPIRMTPDPLSLETYGVRTNAADLLRFVEANIGSLAIDKTLRQAIIQTHTGYFRITDGGMVQDLIWEQYSYPVSLADLEAGNSAKVVLMANPVSPIDPPMPPGGDVLINKTGSTNGFSAYVAFVPEQGVGVVLLANKNYPIAARVAAGYAILQGITHGVRASGPAAGGS